MVCTGPGVLQRNGVIDACKELGVKILAYSPLGKGFLTGRFRSIKDISGEADSRGAGAFPRFNEEVFEHNFKLVEAIEKLAEKKGCKPGQLALAWDTQVYPGLVIAIPGVRPLCLTNQSALTASVRATTQPTDHLPATDQVDQIPRGELRRAQRQALNRRACRDPPDSRGEPGQGCAVQREADADLERVSLPGKPTVQCKTIEDQST